MTEWASDTARLVAGMLLEVRPDLLVTSLFGVEVLEAVSPACPWAVVNSTFYVGPGAPRPLEQDFGPRALPLIGHYATLLGAADLVLHATDPVFDFGFDALAPKHHYVGPLGIWEPPSEVPSYLGEAGEPWVLVTISSQLQDDLERGQLLVSHAGHGSVMKALWHRRPMVLVPWGRDQPGVAARAEALGVARIVPREACTGEALAEAIGRTFEDQTMREAATRHGDRLRVTDPPGAAARLLENLL